MCSSADHQDHYSFHCLGPNRCNNTVKEPYYISSVLANRLIVCLYVKAKEKQLKRGFVQLDATSIFTLRNAKGCGQSTAKERKYHIQTVALGTRQCINTLKRSGTTGNICRGSDSKSKDFRSCCFWVFLTSQIFRGFQ